MRFLSNDVLSHLRRVVDEPDFTGTRYRLGERIGRGGMAVVYAAEDIELGRQVALKVSFTSDPPDVVDRLRREARVLAGLEHPGIVPVHDVGVLPDGHVYYAMKLVKGERLDEWLEKKRKEQEKKRDHGELRAALRLFQRICEALAFAHVHGVLHRDVKPENMMVGEYGEALLMDWGIAGVHVHSNRKRDDGDGEVVAKENDSPRATRAGSVLGTPSYMSPEQARGEIDALDARSDVYGLGATLYFILTGRPPFFDQKTSEDILRSVIEGDSPQPVRAIAPYVSMPLASICAKAMSKRPEDRYASADDLARDIASYLDGASVSAHRETLLEGVTRIAIRHRVILTLLAAYVLMRIVLALFFVR